MPATACSLPLTLRCSEDIERCISTVCPPTGNIMLKSKCPKFGVQLAASDGDVRRCFAVLRQLRTHLTSEENLLQRVRHLEAAQGYRYSAP